MKKVAIIAVLFSLMTISAKAQFFDLTENMDRAVIGFNIGPTGYGSFHDFFQNQNIAYDDYDKPLWDMSNLGIGMSFALLGLYVDFSVVVPDHKFDKKIGYQNFRDHSAFIINFGYQIPIIEHYILITPVIGYSRFTTGWTLGDEISIDYESHSFSHEYEPDHKLREFNYGGVLTIAPCEWFELYATCTNHGTWAGIAFNLMNYQN